MKKILKKCVSCLFITIFIVFNCTYTFAKAATNDLANVNAEGVILVDYSSGRILYEKNADEPMHPASMTKMMTEYLVNESIKNGKIKWDQKVSISDYVYMVSQDNSLSNVPLKKDEQYSVRELYESMAIYSANGSTIALAELIAGSEANFVKMMNDKAASMGLKNCKFVNSTGLNNADLKGKHPAGGKNDENTMSPRSVAMLAFNLLHDYPDVLKTASIPRKIFKEGTKDAIVMDNWNWMIPGTEYPVLDYKGVDGLKTGSTDLGGISFTCTAMRNNMRFISVIMKTTSNYKQSRFIETKKILDYVFSNYEKKDLFPAGYKIQGQSKLPVKNGKDNYAEVATKSPLSVVLKKGEDNMFKPTYTFENTVYQNGKLIAPLSKGQTVGYLTIDYKGASKYGYLIPAYREKVPVIAVNQVKKASFIRVFFRNIIEFISKLF